MCSYFFLLILVNQLELINSLIKPPIKTHPMTCFKFLRNRSEQYSFYSSKCHSLFRNRHNNSYDLLKTALKKHKNGHNSVKNNFQSPRKLVFRYYLCSAVCLWLYMCVCVFVLSITATPFKIEISNLLQTIHQVTS